MNNQEYITEQVIETTTVKPDINWQFSWNIVLIGMFVIFLSLSLTGFIISKLYWLDSLSKIKQLFTRKKLIPRMKDNKSRDTNFNAVVAAITALHYHINEAEESNKMIIAWTREPVSVWKASTRLLMPNRIMREGRR